MARGINGFGGAPSEIYGRFAYTAASAEHHFTDPVNGAATGIVPLVSLGASTGIGAFLLGAGSPVNVSESRQVTSIEGGLGLRSQLVFGALTVVPGLEFAFQRLSSADNVAFLGATSGLGPYKTNVNIDTDYYQFAASIAAAWQLTGQLYLAGSVRASFDLAHAKLRGTSDFVGALDFASATASRSFDSNHSTMQLGFIYATSPTVSISLMGQAQFISAVPGEVFPIYNTAAAGVAPLNGITSVQVSDLQSLWAYGGSIAVNARF